MKKVAVLINSGIGNALLQVPLIKHLINEGNQVDGIFTSLAPYQNLFDSLNVFSSTKTIGLLELASSSISISKKYDAAYLDFFASTNKLILYGLNIAKKVNIRKQPNKLPKSDRIIYHPIVEGLHEISQNMRFIDSHFYDNQIDESLVTLGSVSTKDKTITIQLSSANNAVTYKNWPINKWIELLQVIQEEYPALSIVLLGDKNEIDAAKEVEKRRFKNLQNLVGKTDLTQVSGILSRSKIFVGGDSGLMHLAAFFNTPTFTIWGASDYRLYGYAHLISGKHKMVSNKIDCWPCNRYYSPNKSRYTKPTDCIDNACIREITTQEVSDKLIPFIKSAC